MLCPTHFGDVHKTFNTFFKFDKGTVLDDRDDFTLDLGIERVFHFYLIPMVFFKLLKSEADATFFFIVMKYFYSYLLI